MPMTLPGIPTYTVATIPAASASGGVIAFVSNWGQFGTLAQSNGSRWFPIGGRTVLKVLGAAISGITNTAQLVLQAAIPAGTLKVNDVILADVLSTTKTGTTDSLNEAAYLGTLGTSSDANLLPAVITGMNSTSLTGALLHGFKVLSNTTVQRLGPVTGTGIYSNSSTTAAQAAVTVADLSTNATIFSFSAASSSTTNTVGVQAGVIWHIAG